MPVASLDAESPAWRAARASACIGALWEGGAPPDEVLGSLARLGEPPQGWWDVLRGARAAGGVVFLLPRPGDPRGLALPRGVVAEAAVGWMTGPEWHWIIPDADTGWRPVATPPLGSTPPHPQEALRALRGAVVDAAHTVDALQLEAREGEARRAGDAAPVGRARVRRDQESLVDSWVLGPPPLPTASRQLAALGLGMLMALEAAQALVDTLPLERAARSAVESAFSCTASPR